ncbi:MAG: hypothetical protein WKF43_05960 [Acidimicrobiales bacterium]
MGWAEFLVGDLGAAQEHLWAAAVRHAAEDDTGGLTWCFGILCFTFLSQGRLTQAREVADSLLTRARVEGDPWVEGICTVLLAASLTSGGDVDAGEPLASEGLRHFDELGDTWGQVLARLVLGQAARMRGHHDEARSLLLSGLALSRGVTYVGEDARLLAELAGLEADSGHPDAAVRRARAALAMVRAGLGDHDTGLRALVLLAELAGRAGDRSGAQLLLEEAVATHEAGPAPESWHQANAALALVLLERGDVAGARTLLEAAAAGPGEGVRTAVAVARAEAALAVHDGRPGDARRTLTAALDRDGGNGLVPLSPLRRDLDALGADGERISGRTSGRPTWPT